MVHWVLDEAGTASRWRVATMRAPRKFVLKGAMLFAIWADKPHRPTQDLDLLGFGTPCASWQAWMKPVTACCWGRHRGACISS
jgi:hypothetical protein